jgi:hypothetical protein
VRVGGGTHAALAQQVISGNTMTSGRLPRDQRGVSRVGGGGCHRRDDVGGHARPSQALQHRHGRRRSDVPGLVGRRSEAGDRHQQDSSGSVRLGHRKRLRILTGREPYGGTGDPHEDTEEGEESHATSCW